MFYVFKFTNFKCDQLEGYTNNEFIFRQYIRMINKTFRETVEYELYTESLPEEELLSKYGFRKFQRFRIYKSRDETTVVYCNPLFMRDWLGAKEHTWNMTNRSKVPTLMNQFLNSTISLFQLMHVIAPERRAEFYDPFRRLLIYAIQAVEDKPGIVDQVKLMAYVNHFPEEN